MALTREWALRPEHGANRLQRLNAGMQAQSTSAMSTALCCDWLSNAIVLGAPRQDGDYQHAEEIGALLGPAVGAKPFADALPTLATFGDRTSLELQLQGAAQDWSEKNLGKVLEALPDGNYLVFAYEKKRAQLLWTTMGFIGAGKNCKVLDPYDGQYQGKRSDAAKFVARAVEAHNTIQAKLDGMIVLKATGFPTQAKVTAVAQMLRQPAIDAGNSLVTDAKEIKVGADLSRTFTNMRILNNGQVVRERGAPMDQKETLRALTTALGADWAFPETPNYWDPAKRGPLDEYFRQAFPMASEARKVFQLITQEAMLRVGQLLIPALGVPRHQQLNTASPRCTPNDRWFIDVEVTQPTVKIVHAQSYCTPDDALQNQAYKVRVKVTRTYNRAAKTVTTAVPELTVTRG